VVSLLFSTVHQSITRELALYFITLLFLYYNCCKTRHYVPLNVSAVNALRFLYTLGVCDRPFQNETFIADGHYEL